MRSVQARAKEKATKLHSELVRARGACENCGQTDPSKLQCAHIISRRYSHTRVRLDNALCLCAKCHMHYTEWPVDFTDFVHKQIGVEGYMALVVASHGLGKVDWVVELERLRSIEKAA
jgi:hypothetical protein